MRRAAALLALLCIGASPARVDHARMLAPAPGDWLAHGRTYDEQRFSPLDQIDERSVARLGLAWYADIPVERGVEATPLVIDGVLYNIEPWNVVTAYDARSGRVLWRFDPKTDRAAARLACCDIVTRGVAAWAGRIYLATLDGRLIALDAHDGRPVWSVDTREPGRPYTITGAPRVFDGRVLIGNAGAEGSVRGYVTAYDARSGRQLWRFHTVPGDPSKPQENAALERAVKSWTGEWWKQGGGGTVWDSIAYDPKLGLVYIGTGNGGPWAQAFRSPGGGDNLYLSSIVALRADSGAYVWHYQTTPADQWDYTATQSIILADLVIAGRVRQVLMQAPKNGYFYVLDRATGQLISASNYVPVSWAKGIDLKTGRPIPNPEAAYGEVPVLVTPAPGGGHNWNPMAFSPRTGLAYFPASELYFAFARSLAFKPVPGAMGQSGLATTGYDLNRKAAADYAARNNRHALVAWDPVAQKERWRVPYPARGSGGVLATAGNLVFQGTIEGRFAAYSADRGVKLWELPVQQVPIAAPISYAVDGVQYVAVNAGWGGGIAHAGAPQPLTIPVSKPRLLVFRLGGTATLPPLAGRATLARPPDTLADPATLARGERLFAVHCAACHGAQARGGIEDLRLMSPETRTGFAAVVLEGKRLEKGMPSFAGVLTRGDADAVLAYVTRRAIEDWDGLTQ